MLLGLEERGVGVEMGKGSRGDGCWEGAVSKEKQGVVVGGS